MVRHGETIQREHAEYRRDAAAQNRQLERHNDERRPGMIGTATHIDRVTDDRHPILHKVAGEASDDGADQRYQRHAVLVESDCIGQFFHRERTVGVDLPIAGLMSVPARRDQILSPGELTHDSLTWYAPTSPFTPHS